MKAGLKLYFTQYFSTIPTISRQYKNGTEGGIRTHDPRFRRPMLYPAELLPHKLLLIYFEIVVYFLSLK